MKRRRFLLAALAGLLGARWLLPRLWRTGPLGPLSPEAQAFVARCFAGVDRARVWDSHVHLLGLPEGGHGCWVNPDWRQPWHLWSNAQFDLYLGAAGVQADEGIDAAYVGRLLELQRAANPQGKLVLFAFDACVREDGSEDWEHTTFFVPNDYLLDLAARHPEFVPCASVHPYRVDALERLEGAAAAGARAIKWLPNAMGIDPASPRCDAFYRRMNELRLPLICHGGKESAVDAHENQTLGNPRRVQRALAAGVRVSIAHCGSLGEDGEVEMFDEFLALMGEERYEKLLYADVSALTFVNRSGRILREMLERTDLHPRLLNGSDFPVSAIDPVVSTRLLRWQGYLAAEDARLCEEVFDANPLLFDFVLKRCLRWEGKSWPASVFETDWLFAG